jgi:hypothetical protein
MALSFLNLELERTTESSLVAALDMDDSGALDFREFVALVRRLSRLPCTPAYTLYMPFTRPSHALHTPFTRPSHALHTPFTRPSHALHTPFTRPSHALHTPFTRLSQVRRLSRLPLLSRLFQKYNGDERYMSHKVFETLWQREQGTL